MTHSFRFKYYCVLLIAMMGLSSCYTHHTSSATISTNFKQIKAQYAPVKQGRIEYYRFGQGSPIILIAGYLTDITSWDREFLLELAAHHQVIVFNNRNVGGSVIQSNQYNSQVLANDVAQLIQALHLNKPAVIGLSMGGMLALQLAVLHPDKIGQLILINTAIAGKKAVRPSKMIQEKIFTMPTYKLGRYIVAVQLFFPATWRVKMAYALAAHRFLPKTYHEINPALVMTKQRQLVLEWAQDDVTGNRISQLQLPVFILNGEADAVIPPINSVILARNIPNAQIKRWKEGGHAMIYQFPKQLATDINQFIARQSTATINTFN